MGISFEAVKEVTLPLEAYESDNYYFAKVLAISLFKISLLKVSFLF